MTASANLSLSTILKSAFEQTKKNFVAFIPLILLVLLVVNLAAVKYLGDIDLSDKASLAQLQQKANIVTIVSLLFTPIEIGFMLMGVKAARGLSIKSTDIFNIFPDSAKIVILAIISFVFVQIGMALFILPGLFLLIMVSMAQPLMCDYRLSMVDSVKKSIKTCYKHAGLAIQLYVILFVLILLSFFTYGIALIFTIPFYVNAKGLLYCALFDNKDPNSETSAD
jgi:uncharacterized membrane protein